MFGDLSGPALLLIIGAIGLVIIGAIVWLIVWAVRRASRSNQAELQRAYETGLQHSQQQPPSA